MKRYLIIMMLLCVATVFACAGGNAAKKQTTAGHTAGMKELKKGNGWYQKGCFQRALEHFFKAHELFTASDQLAGVAMSLNNIGNVYRAIDDPNSAVLFFDEAVGIYLDRGNHKGALQSLSNKAAALIDDNKLAEATNTIDRANSLTLKNSKPFGPLLSNQGILFMKNKNYQQAENFLKTALKNTDSLNFSEFAAVNFSFGRLMAQTNRFDEAIGFYNAALAADRIAGFYKGIADDLAAIGSVYYSQEKNKAAVSFFKRAVKVYALIQNKKKVSETIDLLTKASDKAGINTALTEFFVKRWLDEKILEKPCK